MSIPQRGKARGRERPRGGHPAVRLLSWGAGHGQAPLVARTNFASTPSLQVLNLFIALLLNSFSADNLTAPDEDGEVNNLKTALTRIQKFGQHTKKALCSVFSRRPKAGPQPLAKPPLPSARAENHIAADMATGSPTGLPEPRGPGDDHSDFVTNPSVSVSVPIAEGESDLDDLEEEDAEEDAQSSQQEVISQGQVRALPRESHGK